jgi:hypothetical protein
MWVGVPESLINFLPALRQNNTTQHNTVFDQDPQLTITWNDNVPFGQLQPFRF